MARRRRKTTLLSSGASRRRAPRRTRSTRAKISTREYGLSVAPKTAPKRWNYAYARGVGPDRGKRPSYPIVPKKRARAARTYAARKDTAGSLRTIDSAIRARYGSIRAIYSGRRR